MQREIETTTNVEVEYVFSFAPYDKYEARKKNI